MHLSTDGQWRSFPQAPNLLQYVSNGNYYARTKVKGKLKRQSLKTGVWTTAKLRLLDFLKEHRQTGGGATAVPKFSEAVELFRRELVSNTTIKPQSKEYRLGCLHKVETTWPGLWELPLDEITPQACKEWAAKLNAEIACQYYNNTLGTLKQVLAIGIKAYKANGAGALDNPAAEVKRARMKQKDLKLPEPIHFKELVKNLRLKSGGWGRRVADLVEFLAYGGMRIDSEAVWVTWEDVDWQRKEIVVRGQPNPGTKNSEIRRVPLTPDMEALLTRLKDRLGGVPSGRIMQAGKCREALARACKEIGIPRLRQHDLRHLFATRCIESGVDIPTVSRWLGHRDGGALAMRTYGHLRNEHSQAMAQKVKF
jgi:integrase